MAAWSQRARSCSSSSRSRPSAAVRVSRRESVSNSSARRPATAGSLGRSRRSIRHSSSERRTRSSRVSSSPAGTVCPVVKRRCTTASTAPMPLRELCGGRHPIGDPRAGDLLLRTSDPRRHRRLTDEEGAGDLRSRQAAHEPQRQCDLRGLVEGRVAAGHDEPQPVVRDRRVLVSRDQISRPGRGGIVLHQEW